MQTPAGLLNRDEELVPSIEPADRARPATVVTTPCDVTFRIASLLRSATYTFPSPSGATAEGKSNRAEVFVPSAGPYDPASPASVETPTGITERVAGGAVVTAPAL